MDNVPQRVTFITHLPPHGVKVAMWVNLFARWGWQDGILVRALPSHSRCSIREGPGQKGKSIAEAEASATRWYWDNCGSWRGPKEAWYTQKWDYIPSQAAKPLSRNLKTYLDKKSLVAPYCQMKFKTIKWDVWDLHNFTSIYPFRILPYLHSLTCVPAPWLSNLQRWDNFLYFHFV